MSPDTVCIRFARGMDRVSTYPAIAKQAGLRNRFAVIQDTHVVTSPDMVFDETLWHALVEFVTTIDPEGNVTVIESREVRKPVEVPVLAFLQRWSAQAADERSPPHIVVARSGCDVLLCMVTDYWCEVGGPEPYHDSYTYSIYAKVDLGKSLVSFLKDKQGQEKWQVSNDVIDVTEGPEPTLIQKIVDWLR